MTSPPTSKKKSIRELSSIANHLLMTKTLNSLGNFQNSPTPMSSIENTASYLNTLNETKVDATRSNNNNAKPMDNIAALLQFYQTLANATNSSTVPEKSIENLHPTTTTKKSTSTTSEMSPMTYLCRFYQRNRLIELPTNGDFHHGVSRETLKQLIIKEFQLHSPLKENLIVQIWNEQYQEYIDIESFKRIPCEGRLQVFIDKETLSAVENRSNSKSPSTPVSSQMITTTARSMTPNPTQTTPDAQRIQSNLNRSTNYKEDVDGSPQINMKIEQNYDESINTISPMRPMDNLNSTNVMYDLLAKPSEGIPIPRFPPHIAAFLNGNGDANQLNALVQALYQEIVKYELYPNADELRSIVTRLVERYPLCVTVIGSVELLVRKLYYKFCNERKKYPVELKRRQPNKRKRLVREDEVSMISQNQAATLLRRHENLSNDFHQSSLDRLMHLWTSTSANDYQMTIEQTNSPSGSSSDSSSPVSQRSEEKTNELQKSHPLNLSVTTNNNHFTCTE